MSARKVRRMIAAGILVVAGAGCRVVVGPDGIARCSTDAREPTADRCLQPPFSPVDCTAHGDPFDPRCRLADDERLSHDLATCETAGMVGCHVETDADGTRSVYGTPAR
jgi:hypothetical protein